MLTHRRFKSIICLCNIYEEAIKLKDRIKLIRKNAGLTQEAFAQQLGIKRNTVATYETTPKIPMESIITSICREFNVNENWLRTGEGEMYCYANDDDEFQAALNEIGTDDPMAKQVILNYWHMSNSEKELFWNFINRLLKEKGDDL